MIRKLLFRWFLSRGRFSEALAWSSVSNKPRSSEELYACFRLSLYETVANSERSDDHWRGKFAAAVSLAACGRSEEAAVLARSIVNGRSKLRSEATVAALANALAAFAPALALELLENCPPPVDLHAALLLRLGKDGQAKQVLNRAIQAGVLQKQPELRLLLSNAENGSPSQQLAHLNAFLAHYSLSPLALRDESQSLGPLNMMMAGEHRSVRGPLVSVLMTAFCSGNRIESAINSLLGQTYRDIELIVVDDASTDNTGEVVKAIAARDPRVTYLRLPCNVGTYIAKSIGLRHASGEFITCHDSDDWAHPMKIERQVQPLLENRQLVFSTSKWVRMQDDGTYYARQIHPLMRLNPASPMFRKDIVLEHAGGWDTVRTGADSEFTARLKLVFGNGAMHQVSQPLTFGAHRPDSLMNAKATGYSAAGMSSTRLAYWESWGHYHIDELRARRKPYLPVNLLAERRFPAPETIIVPKQDIELCLGSYE